MKALKSITFVTLTYYTSALHAIEPASHHTDAPFNIKGYTWVPPLDDSLLVNIPATTLADVQAQMHKTRSNLTALKSDLTLAVKEKEFSLKDGFITLILPGGILYAAAVKRGHIKAKNELLEITHRLNEINSDISNLSINKQQPKGILVANN